RRHSYFCPCAGPLGDFPSGASSLPMVAFHVAIRITIGFGRSTVRFATIRKLSRPSEAACGVARERVRVFFSFAHEVFRKTAAHSSESCARSRRQAMPKGTVKWFNPTKGYGFIKPNGGDKDVFVHISAVERAGLSTLNENQVVEYDLVENRGKSSAENLKVS